MVKATTDLNVFTDILNLKLIPEWIFKHFLLFSSKTLLSFSFSLFQNIIKFHYTVKCQKLNPEPTQVKKLRTCKKYLMC